MKKTIAILGSTGSIGQSTLEVVAHHPDRFLVAALAGGKNIHLLAEQIRRFHPRLVSVTQESDVPRLRELISESRTEIVWGQEGLCQVATCPDANLVVSAIVGSAGLEPTMAAIAAGKNIALANKETLVIAGALVTRLAREKGVTLLPIDSEHSAIHQSIAGHRFGDIRRILLTASGGPFRQTSTKELESVTVAQALAHPNWSMGRKITIDSATLMNKGLEVIEATWLFDLPAEKIEVVIHPQSIIHSLVEYCDGCMLAQLGLPDMRAPIAYALASPERIASGVPFLDLTRVASLTFESVDHRRFPGLSLAYRALAAGESMPAVFNAANESAVAAFLEERISFLAIARVVEETMSRHSPQRLSSIEEVMEIDTWARRQARELI